MTPSLGGLCCLGWTEWQGSARHFRLCGCSTLNRRPTCGRMRVGQSTRCTKAKEGNDPLMSLLFSDRVWRGSEVPTTKQGIKVLGTPLGHEDFVREHLERTREKHRILLRRIPNVPDVQSAWLLLLHCARANHMLRVVRPEWALDFAQVHDQEVWECLCSILAVPVGDESFARMSTTLPMALGGFGLRSAERSWWPAF